MKGMLSKISSNTNRAWKSSLNVAQKGVDMSVQGAQKGAQWSQQGLNSSVQAVKSINLPGKQSEPDNILCDTPEEALEMLKKMIESEKVVKQKRPQKWNFATVPLSVFSKTMDDMLMAFLIWSKEELDGGKFNVTKAFKRLTSYATWMDNTGRDMVDPPLTTESVKQALEEWKLKVSYDKDGHMVLWLDLTQMNLETIHNMSSTESLRLFCFLAHFILFDPQAQQNGCIMVQDLGQIDLWKGVTLVPPGLAHKVDRLTVGTLPVKMKKVYVCESPQWAQFLLNRVMKPFLSPIVRDRMTFLEETKLLEDLLGPECIPKTFNGTDGDLEKDLVWAAFSIGGGDSDATTTSTAPSGGEEGTASTAGGE